MNPDGVSLSCDDGAHERCPGCNCGCHDNAVWPPDPSPAVRAAGEAPSPGVGDDAIPRRHPSVPGVGGPL